MHLIVLSNVYNVIEMRAEFYHCYYIIFSIAINIFDYLNFYSTLMKGVY